MLDLQKNNTHSLPEEWKNLVQYVDKILLELPLNPEAIQFIEHGLPILNFFPTPIPMLFLTQVAELSCLNIKPQWLVMDGLVPLLWFLKNNPKPEKLKSQLFIHKNLFPFVPPEWRNHFVPSEMISPPSKDRNIHTFNKIYLTGLASKCYCSIEHLEFHIQKIQRFIRDNQVQIEQGFCFLPAKFHPESKLNDQIYYFQYYQKILNMFDCKLDPLTTSDFHKSNFTNSLVYDLSDHHYCGFSEFMNFALSNGAHSDSSFQMKSFNTNMFIPFSKNHGLIRLSGTDMSYVDFDFQKAYPLIENYNTRIEKVFQSNVAQEFPWPNWFADWVNDISNMKINNQTKGHNHEASI